MYRYIDVDENGMVVTAKSTPTENSIDTEGMTIPEMPTDAIYALYYGEEGNFYWVKTADFADIPSAGEQMGADMDYFKMMKGV